MSAVIVRLPDPTCLRAGMQAVRHRAAAYDATADALRRALRILLQEMQAGRSTAAAVALANTSLPNRRIPSAGGDVA